MNNLYHVNINLLPLECHQALQDFVAIFPALQNCVRNEPHQELWGVRK